MTVAKTLRAPRPAAVAGVDAEFILTFHCRDALGIVQAVAAFLLKQECYIVDIKQFGDKASGEFFMRVHFSAEEASDGGLLRDRFGPLAGDWGMQWRLEPRGRRRKVLVMVSKYDHCLRDLLARSRDGDLPVEIVGVVSNHPESAELAAWHGIPFHHIPVTAETKPGAEAKLMELVDGLNVELVVLARYMQVLSDDLTRKLDGRAINIHHSTYTPEDLVRVGKDAECRALTNAVRWHAEGRIILSGNRTVILR